MPETTASLCAEPQRAASHHCREAERLAEAAHDATEQLRQVRRQRAALAAEFDDSRLGDRRVLNDAKAEALQGYRAEYERAHDTGALMVATATWMSNLSQLNKGARRARREAESLARRQIEVDALVERLELAADAARIAAASARQSCLDSRRALAACEEAHYAALRPAAVGAGGPVAGMAMAPVEDAARPAIAAAPVMDGEIAVVALLRGDRAMLQAVVTRLAEEIGQDAGQLQLLMLDLRHSIIGSGLRACVYDFPARHPFWEQFTIQEARSVASALATLGRHFDGHDGWANGQIATARELAMAISLAGRDPRSIRWHPTPGEIETLWQGTSVAAAEFLFANAPDLRLESLIALLGPRADALGELWDNWGRLRPLLLGHVD
jgi:hypothetical protein